MAAWQDLSQKTARRDTLSYEQYAGLLTQTNLLQHTAESFQAQLSAIEEPAFEHGDPGRSLMPLALVGGTDSIPCLATGSP